ncbi:MAG TPA: transposase [Candidatus Kapabacteria bacterium]|nr:transposase [Candidatus Kapabacteria bacterium]
MSRAYRHYAEGEYVYFVTWTVVDWLAVFTTHERFTVLIEALAHGRAEKGLLVHAYVAMPNHAHLIISSEPTAALPGIVRDLKRHTSRVLTHMLEESRAGTHLQHFMEAARRSGRGNEYALWLEGYHPVAIYTQRFFRQKLDYLHDNPVRKGYVRRAEDWQYSSAGDYITGERGPLELDLLAL